MADTTTEAASAQSVPAQQAAVVDCTEEEPDEEGDVPFEPELENASDEEGWLDKVL